MGKNRTTTHKGKNGCADHNKHEFMNGHEDVYWVSCEGNTEENKGSPFSVKELEFYKRYSDMLSQQNDKYLQNRQYGRVKSLEQLYNSKRYKPSEEILQYGHVGGDVPSRDDFNKMVKEYVQWQREWSNQHGNHLHVLNYANHFDEATPHCHKREIWDFVDEDGVIKINQEEAMKQAGLELPDPSKPEGRYNNRGITYSRMCRNMWNDICEKYGYEVERVPLPGKQKSKTISQYKSQKEREIQEREQVLKTREREIIDIIGNVTGYDYRRLYTVEEAVEDLSEVMTDVTEQLDKLDEADGILQDALRMYDEAGRFYQAAEAEKKQQELQHMLEQISRHKKTSAGVVRIMAKWDEYEEPVRGTSPKYGYLP